jgi:hypothetical protein
MLRSFLVQSTLLGIEMYAAVNLQNDVVLDAEEVGDVTIDHLLPSKLESEHSAIA